jgi:Effector protein
MSNINIDGANDYRRSVEEQLTKIQRNPVGLLIVNSIEDGKRDVIISPYTDLSNPNSKTTPKDVQAAAPKGVSGTYRTDHGAWYTGEEDDPTTSKDERYNRMPSGQGTGQGSDVKIKFSVGVVSSRGPGSEPDEVLCHELVHALRMTQGKLNTIPTDDNIRPYDNEEEFLAVVTTNVYMSANNKVEFRADHNGHKRLEPPLNTSEGFLVSGKKYGENQKGNLELMQIYNLVWQPTFLSLSMIVTAKFNPFYALTTRLAYLRGSGYSSVWSTPKDVLAASRHSSAKALGFLK